MEVLILICLFVVIMLLLKDTKIIQRRANKPTNDWSTTPVLPDVMGGTKVVERTLNPTDNKKIASSFNGEILASRQANIADEELDEIFAKEIDWEEEEEEWAVSRQPNGEDGLASGVSFEELNTARSLLEQEELGVFEQKQAADIVLKIQGTELFTLLEDSIKGAKEKIAILLDNSMIGQLGFNATALRKKGLEEFDINAFV